MLCWPLLLAAASALAAALSHPLAEPSISPDASEIAFVSGGDIWTVPSRGGEARLLVSHPANESRPLYSPDGKRLAFSSTRTGNGDIYVLTLATGEIARLTWDDAAEQVDGWSRDGQWVYFHSTSRDIAGMTDIHRVRVSGGTPMPVTDERYSGEYFAAPSPDGAALAFNARGSAGTQWWRKGHSHMDESEIWIRRSGSPAAYERVTEGGAKEVWAMWARDGRGLYYMSDRSGAQNIWFKPGGGKPRQVTRFTSGRVLWPAISADGRAMVFERDFGIWRLDTETGRAAAVEIVRRGAPAASGSQRIALAGQFQEFALSPDGRKIAVTSHGEVFAASAREAGDATRITRTPAPESDLAWSPDSRRLGYVSTREGAPRLWVYDFNTGKESRLTETGPDWSPRWSPDGKSIAFIRDAAELRVVDVATRKERSVARGFFDRPPIVDERPFAWSPDGRWLAFFNVGGKAFSNVSIASAAGGDVKQASWLANAGSNGVEWGRDGKYLLLATGQRTEPGQVARIDLVPRTPRFREDQFRDLFRDVATRPAPIPTTLSPEPKKSEPESKTEIVFEGIRRRLSLLPVGLDVDEAVLSPDGKQVALLASSAGQQNIYAYSLDELAKEPSVARQLTSTPGRKGSIHFTPDSKEVFYLERGAVFSVTLETRQPKPLAVAAFLDVEFATEKREVFAQSWGWLRDHFYDPKFHGVDWEAVRREYEPMASAAATIDELRRLLNLMVGELNASHLGATAPPTATQTSTGRLGLRFDSDAYEREGKLKVTEVVPLGPADVAGIKPGDVLEAVEGVRIEARTNLDELLDHSIGKRMALTVSGRETAALPVNLTTEKALVYTAWVERNREYVARASGGKLGYVHMLDMGQASLDRLHLDLDAENHAREGVVIDIRNNNGGFVNAYALDVFSRRPYLKMTQRGREEAPARTVLGQRALEAPTVLVVNRHSLSDAEDFTEGYRTLKLGKVVGEPTAGWIIYTWNNALLDGTMFRLPRTRIRGSAGDDMELKPRPVDVPVARAVGESFAGRDSQLDAAVKELLKDIAR